MHQSYRITFRLKAKATAVVDFNSGLYYFFHNGSFAVVTLTSLIHSRYIESFVARAHP